MKQRIAYFLVFVLLTITVVACGRDPSTGVMPGKGPMENNAHHPALWSTQLAAALQVASEMDSSAVLTQVKADPTGALQPGDFQTLDVRYHFMSQRGTFWVTLDDTNVQETIRRSGKIVPADRTMSSGERERLGKAITRVQVSPSEVIQRTRTEVERQVPQHTALRVELRLRLLDTPPQWAIRYYADVGESTREFAFRVDATSGAILSRSTHP